MTDHRTRLELAIGALLLIVLMVILATGAVFAVQQRQANLELTRLNERGEANQVLRCYELAAQADLPAPVEDICERAFTEAGVP